MASFQNFLFDWDGTLADSPAVHAEAFRVVLAKAMPQALSTFRYEAFSGCTTRDVFEKLGAAAESIPTLTAEKQALYRAMIQEGRLSLLPEAETLLQRLRAKGKRLFLVTGGSRGSVEPSLNLKGLAPLFEGIVTGDDVAHGKPDPESFRLCLDRFGLSPEHSVVLEDAPNGTEAAHKAGLAVIGLHNEELRTHADYWFTDIPGLLASLDLFTE